VLSGVIRLRRTHLRKSRRQILIEQLRANLEGAAASFGCSDGSLLPESKDWRTVAE
jgi:hypothetical protein